MAMRPGAFSRFSRPVHGAIVFCCAAVLLRCAPFFPLHPSRGAWTADRYHHPTLGVSIRLDTSWVSYPSISWLSYASAGIDPLFFESVSFFGTENEAVKLTAMDLLTAMEPLYGTPGREVISRPAMLFCGHTKSRRAFVQCFAQKSTQPIADWRTLIFAGTLPSLRTVSSRQWRSAQADLCAWQYVFEVKGYRFHGVDYLVYRRGMILRLSCVTLSTLFEDYDSAFVRFAGSILFDGDSAAGTRPFGLTALMDDSAAGESTPPVAADTLLYEDTVTVCRDPGKLCFWRVRSGAGTAWLLGSVHFAKPEFYPLPRVVEDAARSSEILVFEAQTNIFDSERMLKLAINYYAYTPPATINSEMHDSTLELVSYVLRRYGFSIDFFTGFKPALLSMVFSFVATRMNGYGYDWGIDNYILDHFGKDRKVFYLETEIEHLAVMHVFDNEKYLYESAASCFGFPGHAVKLLRGWKCGDDAVMLPDPIRTPDEQRFFEKLILERNARMTDRIVAYLKSPTTYFVVAGAAHFVGDNSIIDQLKKRGYSPERF